MVCKQNGILFLRFIFSGLQNNKLIPASKLCTTALCERPVVPPHMCFIASVGAGQAAQFAS